VPSFRNVKHCENFSDRHWYQTSYCMVVVWPTPPVSTGSNGTGAHAIKSNKKWDGFAVQIAPAVDGLSAAKPIAAGAVECLLSVILLFGERGE
jgi:hypothetical protein